MNCEKCQDRGFIELDGIGLRNQLCDCEKAREVAERNGLPWREKVESVAQASNNFLAVERQIVPMKVNDDSNSRTEPDNTDIGSRNTSQPELPKKQTFKRKSRKRTK
ncbi:hypothetical protein KKE60_06590 [Patescibacteria group bacterium]|nr:hypothetical protein [Patescibacteria group bacterium]